MNAMTLPRCPTNAEGTWKAGTDIPATVTGPWYVTSSAPSKSRYTICAVLPSFSLVAGVSPAGGPFAACSVSVNSCAVEEVEDPGVDGAESDAGCCPVGGEPTFPVLWLSVADCDPVPLACSACAAAGVVPAFTAVPDTPSKMPPTCEAGSYVIAAVVCGMGFARGTSCAAGVGPAVAPMAAVPNPLAERSNLCSSASSSN